MWLLGAVVLLGVAVRAAAAPVTIERIEVLAERGSVRLHLSAPVTPRASALRREGAAPERVYVDLPGVELDARTPTVVAGGGTVLRVRAGQFDEDTARVVLDLAHAEPFAVHTSGSTVTIELGTSHLAPPRTFAEDEAEPEAVAKAEPEPEPEPRAREPFPPPPLGAATVEMPPDSTRLRPAAPPTPEAPVESSRLSDRPPFTITEPAPAPVFPPEAPPVVAARPKLLPDDAEPEPDAVEPELAEPELAEPEVAEPEVVDPELAEPEATEPDATDPPPVVVEEKPQHQEEPPAIVEEERDAPPPVIVTPAPPVMKKVPRTIVPVLPVVVLDPGHGGRDPGAAGVGGVVEKEVALAVTQRLAARLATSLPAIIVMTRADDSFVSIDRRLAVPGDTATVFVSLHANASNDPALHGIEIFYGGGEVQPATTNGTSRQAATLGRCLGDALRARVRPVRRPRPGDFGVLVRNRVPSALVEIGYLTHPEEGARAQDPEYQELLANALADGLAAFLRVPSGQL